MALGDDRKGNNKNKLFENQYYSRLGFRNYSGGNNDKRLGISYKSGMILLDISKPKDGGFEYETLVSIYITPTKAKILSYQIDLFNKEFEEGLSNPEKGFGINTGMGEVQTVLYFHVTDNRDKAVTIAKIDKNGNITSSEEHVFNTTDFHYGLEFTNFKNMEFDKNFYPDIEIEQLKETLDTFAMASNGAIGYSVADITRYDYRALMNKMNPIYDALGIERNTGGNSRNNTGGGFFNNNNNRGSSNHKSYENMTDDLPFEDDED